MKIKTVKRLLSEANSKEVLPLTSAEKQVDGTITETGLLRHIPRTPAKTVRVYASSHEGTFAGCIQ